MRSLFALALGAALCASAHAQTATTDPVGFSTISLPADSDSYVYLPFKRTPEFAGTASGPAVSNVIPVAGTPGWTANQFVYVQGSQPKTYYVFVVDGSRGGMFYTVTANTANSITVDSAGDDLSAAFASGTRIQVIPYDTLGTIFPAGQSVVASTSHSLASRMTEILLPDTTTAGTNLGAGAAYYYYSGVSGVGPGWRKSGFTSVLADDTILAPDSSFIVRHKPGSSTTLTFMGTVQMATLQTPVGTIANNVAQDNAVALPVASTLTLAQTKLFESGAFAVSPTHSLASRGDELLVFDNSVIGHNKGATKSYYYYSGTSGVGPGWRQSGVTGTIADTDVVVSPTLGIVVRKKAAATAGSTFWAVKPPYVP